MLDNNSVSRSGFLQAKEPTGPAPVSVWKLIRGYRIDPLKRWREIHREYGDVARYRFGFDDTYLIAHPDGARRVLQENAPNYTKRHPAYALLRSLVGNGIFTSDGAHWLRQRRLAQPAFHRQRIAQMAAQMVTAALALADEWEARLAGEPYVLMQREMSRLTLRVVVEALFGAADASQVSQVGEGWGTLDKQLVDRLNKRRFLPHILPTRYDRAFRAARRSLFTRVDEIIARKRTQLPGAGTDLLSMLLAARDEETGAQMTNAQLRDEVVTMLLAGHETTAVTLTWTWFLLDQHPRVREELLQELDSVLGSRPPTAEDYGRLTYTRAVIDESMRLYPPAYIFFRRATEDDVVSGHRVYAGASLVIPPLLYHRDETWWETPDAFLPERWLGPDKSQSRPRFAFMPFSGGPRQCIGNTFALMEATLVLATLAQRFAPTLAEGYVMQPEYRVTLQPSGGLPMQLRRRADVATRPASSLSG